MKVSLNWLNEYTDVSSFFSNTDPLAQILTDAGLEVDAINDMAKNFSHVVMAKIIELVKHPDADKLTVCQVDIGTGELQQIVCGAKNHQQGDYVVAALPGAILPGDFKIKKSKIRGVESLGMLCSQKELALSDESEGIIVLKDDSIVPGQSFAEHFGKNDVVFELGVTANRSDCLSHIGLARELSCLLNQELKLPDSSLKASQSPTKEIISVELKDEVNCPRYTARVIKGVKVGPSPQWLKNRLESVDINSVNNVVDITNYIMLEFGQPMHAFDLHQIEGQKIEIKAAEDNEVFVSLDGSEHKLAAGDLGIYDANKLVALAGVVGGQNSGISDDTQDLLLEVAHFTPGTVRKTSRRLGISTDAAYRFSRGTDPSQVIKAMERACSLIQELCGGDVSEGVIDCYPQPIQRQKIQLAPTYLEERLGYAVAKDDFLSWMKRLGCEFCGEKNQELSFLPPSWRWDLEIKEDLVEEYGRLNGYDKIPESLPSLSYEPLTHDASYIQDRFVQSFFAKQGFYQAVNYNFLGGEALSEFLGGPGSQFEGCGFLSSEELATVQNPLSEEYNTMRPSLSPSLYKNLMTNYRSGVSSSQIFEVGKVFGVHQSEYFERRHLGLLLYGQSQNLWQNNSSTSPQVFTMKSYVENFLRSLKAKSWSWKPWEPKLSFLHPGRSATLFFEGKLMGYIGEIHPKLKSQSKLREDVAFAEFDLELLMRSFPKKPKLQELSKYPAVERDFSFVVSESVSASEIVSFIAKTNKKLIQNVSVIDRFVGGDLKAGSHSLTFRVLLQDSASTLSEEVIKSLQSEILTKVQSQFS